MENKDYINHYKKDAELFSYFENNKYDADYNNRLHTFIEGFITGKNKKILDIGSGGGWSIQKFSKNGTLYLIDLAHNNLKSLKQKYVVNPTVGDAIKLPFKDNGFDYVIISEVLEHINNPEPAIREALRVTKKNGKIIITTPYNEIIRYYLCIHCNQMTPANAHLHSFTINSFEKLIDSNNYSNIKFYKFGSKILTVTRISYMLRFLPFWLWRMKDKFFNMLADKPNTLITVITK